MSQDGDVLALASAFTKQFYEKLTQSPQDLHKFYTPDAGFTHSTIPDEVLSTVYGTASIQERVAELQLAGSSVDLCEGTIDAQKSENDGILILVTGLFKPSAIEVVRPFIQTFFLSTVKANGRSAFFLRNSVFRLLSASAPAPTTSTPTINVHAASSNPAAAAALLAALVTPTTAAGTATAAAAAAAVLDEEDDYEEEEEEEDDEEEEGAENGTTAAVATGVSGEDDLSTVVSAASQPQQQPVTASKPAPAVTAVAPALPVAAAQPVPVAKPRSFLEAVSRNSDATTTAATAGAKKTTTRKSPKKAASPSGNTSETSAAAGTVTSAAPPAAAASATTSTQQQSSSRGASSSNDHRSKYSVYVRNLTDQITESQLSDLFEKFGRISSVDLKTGKGFAFVEFHDATAVQGVLSQVASNSAFFKIGDTTIKVEGRSKQSGSGGGGGRSRGGERGDRGSSNKQGESPAAGKSERSATAGESKPRSTRGSGSKSATTTDGSAKPAKAASASASKK